MLKVLTVPVLWTKVGILKIIICDKCDVVVLRPVLVGFILI